MVKQRSALWNDLKRTSACEVLILGGGVNGAALFRELALQGIHCVLLDKGDFCAGASSASSRMIHGGLRYLENAEFELVREALRERNRLLKYAPHFVFPLRTTIPIASWLGGLMKSPLAFFGLPVTPGGRGAVIIKLGLWLYDFMTRKRRQTPRHFFLSRDQSLRQMPALRGSMVCTATYWDAWISHAERLCIDLIAEAMEENPACLALNYAAAVRSGSDKVLVKDQVNGEEVALKPVVVVNATGAWIDVTNRALGLESRFMGGTKGSHLVIGHRGLYDALGDRMIYYEHEDGRICIVFRFLNLVIMGSTDIRIDHPDEAKCDDQEIDYMLKTLHGVFPDLDVSRRDIVYSFCGVRPLPASGLGYTSRVPRSHFLKVVEPDPDRSFPIYCMVGGKLTTFRSFAEQTADGVLQRLGKARKVSTAERYYPHAKGCPADPSAREHWSEAVANAHGLERARIADLLGRYGTAAQDFAKRKEPSWRTPLKTLPDYTIGEIEHLAAHECIHHLSDLVRRRSVITLLGQSTEPALAELADIVGAVLGWDPARRKSEIELALTEAAGGR